MKNSIVLGLFFSQFLISPAGAGLVDQVYDQEIRNTVSMYVYPPRKRLNWERPQTLIRGFLSIYAGGSIWASKEETTGTDKFGDSFSLPVDYRSSMGHSILQVSCTLPDGERFSSWTSFSGQNYREVDKQIAFKDQLGLGMLFYDFIDGHIINGDENKRRLIYIKGALKGYDDNGKALREKPRRISMEVTPKRCLELKKFVNFFEEFHFAPDTPFADLKSKNEDELLYFTNNLDVYDSYQKRMEKGYGRVGGGCAPYAVAGMKLAKYFTPELEDKFKLNIKISEKHIGNGYDKKVPLPPIISGRKVRSWQTDASDPHRLFSQWDPQLIWDFIGEVRACLGEKEFDDSTCTPFAKNWLIKYQSKMKIDLATPVNLQHTRTQYSEGALGRGGFDTNPMERDITTTMKIEGIDLSLNNTNQ